jgi:hypothetical protein
MKFLMHTNARFSKIPFFFFFVETMACNECSLRQSSRFITELSSLFLNLTLANQQRQKENRFPRPLFACIEMGGVETDAAILIRSVDPKAHPRPAPVLATVPWDTTS